MGVFFNFNLKKANKFNEKIEIFFSAVLNFNLILWLLGLAFICGFSFNNYILFFTYWIFYILILSFCFIIWKMFANKPPYIKVRIIINILKDFGNFIVNVFNWLCYELPCLVLNFFKVKKISIIFCIFIYILYRCFIV